LSSPDRWRRFSHPKRRSCAVFDGSDDSLAAARIAVDLGRRLDAPVQMIHVTERPRLSGSRLTEGDYGARLVASHAAAMRCCCGRRTSRSRRSTCVWSSAAPAERLADIAAREGAQLIVNGSSGRGARSGTVLGSVPSRLALTGSQPLVLVRAGGRAAVVADGRTKMRSAYAPRSARGVRRSTTGVRDIAIREAIGPR